MSKRLISRLQLEPFYHEAPMQTPDWQPAQVTLPLQQHIGAPADPIVQVGDAVTVGQCIASAKAGALSVALHASIAGHVSAVSASSITLSRG